MIDERELAEKGHPIWAAQIRAGVAPQAIRNEHMLR